MSSSLAAVSDHQARCALIARIVARHELLVAMAPQASNEDLEELADDEEEDLKALAQLPGDHLQQICDKAALLAGRELEERITFGELALIFSIISDLTRQSHRPVSGRGG